ncbi:MAG TPA: hypothetical protein VL360_00625 [Gammaproteobacteria bacterium]|jgi:hypothetical protein|nr:hypothetical protein [Gammaproteobacteria bacterium]
MQSRPADQSTEQSNKTDYVYSSGTAALFLTSRFFSYVGLTNLSFYMDGALALLLATRAFKDINTYGPAKAFDETKRLAQNPVALFNNFRASKRPVENKQIEEATFSSSPALNR